MNAQELFEKAQEKVQSSEALAPHEDFILADWPEGEEHLEWVISADEEEISDWVKSNR